jgi:hypothetical protein
VVYVSMSNTGIQVLYRCTVVVQNYRDPGEVQMYRSSGVIQGYTRTGVIQSSWGSTGV